MRKQNQEFNKQCASFFVVGFLLGIILINSFGYRFLRRNRICLQKQSLHFLTKKEHTRGQDQFLFIGVITTWSHLHTHAAAISQTWGKRVPGKIVFFVGKGQKKYSGNLSLVVLNDVSDHAYPPQKKSFAMLKYIRNNYINDFEWFMRVDDDIFIRPDLLELFLRSVNSSRRLYIGQPGQGVPKERGKLGLPENSFFFCMGGPGIIFSRDTLMRTAAGLDACLERTYTHHEDTELGRCVNEHAKVSCTSAYEFKIMFYQNHDNRNGSFEGRFDPKVNLALTLHPVKRSQYVYRLETYFNFRRLFRLKYAASQLQTSIDDTENMLPRAKRKTKSSNENSHEKNAKKYVGSDDENNREYDIWTFIRSGLLFSNTHPYQNPHEVYSRRGRDSRINATIFRLNVTYAERRPPVFHYEKISLRVGVEQIVAVGNKPNLKSYAAIQRFARPELGEVPGKSLLRRDVIYVILPVYKRSKTFYNFLASLKTTVHSFRGRIRLRVVLCHDKENEYLSSVRYYRTFNCKCRNLEKQLFQLSGPFSKAKAMNKGAENLTSDSLLLFMDLDMIFTAGFLDRVILNTKRGRHAFFPISFSLYNPRTVCLGRKRCHFKNIGFEIDQDRGTWRHFGFGIVGIYKDDFVAMGMWDSSIKGWGKEDTVFYEKCLNYRFTVFRSIEPGLVHVHHVKHCNVTLPVDRFTMCLASRVEMYASQRVLANIALNITSLNSKNVNV